MCASLPANPEHFPVFTLYLSMTRFGRTSYPAQGRLSPRAHLGCPARALRTVRGRAAAPDPGRGAQMADLAGTIANGSRVSTGRSVAGHQQAAFEPDRQLLMKGQFGSAPLVRAQFDPLATDPGLETAGSV